MGFFGTVKNRESGAPMVGVPVSDGRNVVLTDAEGCYRLEGWERANVLHVGILTEGDDDWFRNVGDGECEVNFLLTPARVGENFCFFHVSDIEIEGREDTAWVDFMHEKVLEHRPAFFSNTGDLARSGVPRHRELMNRGTMGCPVRYAIGNHDYLEGAYGEAVFERLYGPTWYSFDCGKIHFVTLSMLGSSDHPSGYAPEDQWLWLKNDLSRLSPDQRIIVLAHNYCRLDFPGFCPEVAGEKFDLPAAGLIAWLFGHYHVHFMHEYGGVLHACTARPDSGGIDSSPGGVRKLTLRGTELSGEMLYCMPAPTPSEAAVWQTNVEGHISFSTPVVTEDAVFVATDEDALPRHCGISCLDRASGALVWNVPTEYGFRNEMAYEAGLLYAQDTKGEVYCLSAQDGALLWKTQLPSLLPGYTRSNVLIVEDLLLAGNPAHLYALDKKSGEIRWDAALGKGENTPSRLVYDPYRRQVLIGIHWLGLFAFDPFAQKLLWECRERAVWFRTATPLVTADHIYTAGDERICALDPTCGRLLAESFPRCKMDVSGAPVLDGGVVYYPTANRGVIAVDAQTLEVLRRFPVGNTHLHSSPYLSGEIETVESTPQIDGEQLIFAASDAGLYVYRKESGALCRRVELGAPCLATPHLDKEFFLTADFEGRVSCFKR